MLSRRDIISRSRDDLDQQPPVEDENSWSSVNACFQQHIREVLMKWEQIDDEIWSKVIVFEKNRRVAKAYLRSPVLTINGSDIGFDGYRLGLSGFENPMRDQKTEVVINRHVGKGCKLRMDQDGNILVKRISQANVFCKFIDNENAISSEVLRLPNQGLEQEVPIKAFDIRKFEENIEREMDETYPNRAKLEAQCILPLAFAKTTSQLLSCPSWVMIINIVGLELLKTKMAPIAVRVPPPLNNRPRLPVPEEDDKSSSGASGRGGPPKLPPREPVKGSKGEYVYIDPNNLGPFQRMHRGNGVHPPSKNDDPYYCGLRARTTNYKGSDHDRADQVRGSYMPPHLPPHPLYHPPRGYDMPHRPMMPVGKPMGPFSAKPMPWNPVVPHQNYETEWETYWAA